MGKNLHFRVSLLLLVCLIFFNQDNLFSQTIRLEIDPYRATAEELNRTNDCLRQNNNNWYGNVCNTVDDGDDPENTDCDDCLIGGDEDMDVGAMWEAGGNYTGMHLINDQTCGWKTWGSGWASGDPQSTYTWYINKTETIRGRLSGAEDDSGFCSGDLSGSNDGECSPSPYGGTWGSLPNTWDTYNANTGSWYRDNGIGLDIDDNYCPYAWTGYHQNTIENCMLENGTNDYRTQWRYRWVFGNSAGTLVGMTNTISGVDVTVCPPYDRTLMSGSYTNCEVNFQWEINTNSGGWVTIGGATANSYDPPNISTPGVYQYRRRIGYRNSFSGGIGYTYSNTVTTTIVADPTITASGSTTICSGGTATLTSVTSGGTGSCSYQWQIWNGSAYVNIPGANSSSYTTSVLSSTSIYRVTRSCTGTNCNTATSNAVTVTVTPLPTISASGSATICSGGDVTMTASTTNASSCTIQWQIWNGSSWVDVVGANSANYTANNIVVNTSYRATLDCGGCGTFNSSPVSITVTSVPTISASGATTICSGGSATITSSSSGGIGSCSFQWQTWNGSAYVDMPGETGSTLYTGSLTSTSFYRIGRICTGIGCNTSYSNVIEVTVVPDISISASGGTTLCAGETTLLTSSTTGGTGTCTYQWQANGGTGWTNIPGANSANHTTAPATVGLLYRVIRSCSGTDCGDGVSNTISLNVATNATVSATMSPAASTVCEGQTLTLINPLGSGGITPCEFQYQYSTDGGATYSGWSTTVPNFAATGTDNRIQIMRYCGGTPPCGASFPATYTWTITPDPSVSISAGGSICTGQTFSFTASSGGGNGTCSYQWQSSTDNVSFSNIGGATGATYTTPALASTTYYRVQRICSGLDCGTATSPSRTVTVNPGGVSAFTDTICANEMYTLPSGATVMGAGVYADVVAGAYCDSTITVTLVTPPSAAHYGLYAASPTDYHQINPLTGAIINSYGTSANSLGWINGAFTIHEQTATLYWLSEVIQLHSLDLTSGVQSVVPTGISGLPFFWGLKYYNGYLYTITTSLDNDKTLVRIDPSTGAIDGTFTPIEINGSAGYDILVHESMVVNPMNGVLYIPLYGNVMLAFDIAAGTGTILNLTGYVTGGGFIGLLEINENTGEMYALSGFSDVVNITVTGPSTASVALVKSLTSGSGFSNPISTFDSDNELYIFQAQSGCSADNPLISIDVNTGTEYCSDPPGVAFYQMEYLNCTPPSVLRTPESFGVNLYPNPVKDVLKLEVDLSAEDDVIVRVFNISGALVYEQQTYGELGNNRFDLDVSGLTPGMHIVHVSSGKKQYTGKIIKL